MASEKIREKQVPFIFNEVVFERSTDSSFSFYVDVPAITAFIITVARCTRWRGVYDTLHIAVSEAGGNRVDIFEILQC